MKKSIKAQPAIQVPAPKKEFSRLDRRNAVLNAIATRLMNDPAASWSSFGSLFTDAIFPRDVSLDDLTEENVREKLKIILAQAIKAIDKQKSKGDAADLIRINKDMPRGKRR